MLIAISGCIFLNNNDKDETAGLVPAGQVAATVYVVGHLGSMVGIPQFYVNSTWGGSSSGRDSGGGVCCVALSDPPKQPVVVTVKWQTCDISQIKFVNDQVVDPNARCELEWHEATVPVHFAEDEPGKVIPPQRVSVKSRIFLNAILRKFYMKISRFTESQIINILKQAEAGTLVPKL